ncbi:hypothetical protein BDF20DRAFT_831813 [Mycotypha africana]|uniref:uncharacterized protein n=1 Tax=Mycotypha africana TaxID=64632 RepID=UPI0022FFD3D4|nr:uncharacterized protein BDF20DRAFT_831813 [Mycotypha africana]KAI8991804.1 hypothetical protein BDF20DRAFT_831813 [Mycotypha africana]
MCELLLLKQAVGKEPAAPFSLWRWRQKMSGRPLCSHTEFAINFVHSFGKRAIIDTISGYSLSRYTFARRCIQNSPLHVFRLREILIFKTFSEAGHVCHIILCLPSKLPRFHARNVFLVKVMSSEFIIADNSKKLGVPRSRDISFCKSYALSSMYIWHPI